MENRFFSLKIFELLRVSYKNSCKRFIIWGLFTFWSFEHDEPLNLKNNLIFLNFRWLYLLYICLLSREIQQLLNQKSETEATPFWEI